MERNTVSKDPDTCGRALRRKVLLVVVTAYSLPYNLPLQIADYELKRQMASKGINPLLVSHLDILDIRLKNL